MCIRDRYNNAEKFNSRFPSVNNAAGPFDFGLGSVGDALRLYDGSGLLYQSLVYGTVSPWPQAVSYTHLDVYKRQSVD